MHSRRAFIKRSGLLGLGTLGLFQACSTLRTARIGVQLYSVREDMLADAAGTLEKLARIGYNELESARSVKGFYYGLGPAEIRSICGDLGVTLRSGHVALDSTWQQAMDEAAQTGQEYLICSSLPFEGQTVDNYKRVAEAFNKAGEQCRALNIRFGYHNHDFEFEQVDGKVLYDILMDETDPELVKMELDLGWVVATGNDPKTYFERYPDRFELWHLKDMDLAKKESTEFGKGGLDIPGMLASKKQSGLEYFFVEQEEYTHSALQSLQDDYDYLMKYKEYI